MKVNIAFYSSGYKKDILGIDIFSLPPGWGKGWGWGLKPAAASTDLRTNPKKQIPNPKIFKSFLIIFLTLRFYFLTLHRKVLLNENEIIQSQ